jgi:ATP adenylyltransferase
MPPLPGRYPSGASRAATLGGVAHALRPLPGSLAAAIAARRASALREGALVPIATREHVIEEDGVAFSVRVAPLLARKAEATREERESAQSPFLPYEAALFVCEVCDAYVCLLNKFYVLDGHVLLVTRRFEEQADPLAPRDFAALFACLRETAGLGFFNSGAVAGASQRHRHLQLVPLPLGPGPEFPLAARLAAEAEEGRVRVASSLPFPVALARIESLAEREAAESAPALAELYREMLATLGLEPGRAPHNLLATRRLLWLVPRARAEWRGIPVNALGFAGALLVPDDEALGRLRAAGPFALLRAVAAGERV